MPGAKKQIHWMLDELEGFETPKIKLEQYATSSELAVKIMEMIDEEVGLTAAKLVDIGCGCGMLMTSAAALYEPQKVVGVDVDEDALAVCKRNLRRADVEEMFGFGLLNLKIDVFSCELRNVDVLDVGVPKMRNSTWR
uniref:Methyltransferase domain-containing protein n=1 Tax=Caenorhabditis japonica TaxID=281687 RepID=A0A8R1ENF2_CAEJA